MSKKSNTIGLTAVLTLAVAFLGILAVQPDASAVSYDETAERIDWTNGLNDNVWNDSLNWSPNDVPNGAYDTGADSEETALINMSGSNRAELTGGTDMTVYGTYIGASSDGTAVGELYVENTTLTTTKATYGLDIGGLHTQKHTLWSNATDPSSDWTGTGTLTLGANGKAINAGPESGKRGWHTKIGDGGAVFEEQTNDDGDPVTVKVREAADGTLKMEGAGAEFRTEQGGVHLGLGGGTGTIDISAGDFKTLNIIDFGKGTFTVRGNTGGVIQPGAISSSGYNRGAWRQGNEGNIATLQPLIDGSGTGVTPIEIDGGDYSGDVAFGADAKLAPGFASGATPREGTWTVMTWQGAQSGVTADSLQLADGVDDSKWSFNIDDATNDELTVTYVPEPGSLAMLLIGAAALLGTRRRRRS